MIPNTIKKHSFLWPIYYRKEWLLIHTLLRGRILDVQHVGSTAIPKIPPRPIIDILVAIAEYEKASESTHLFERLGYIYLGEDSTQRKYYFEKREKPCCQLFMLEAHNEEWERKIYFRDIHNQDTEKAIAYSNLKMSLAKRFPTNLKAYQAGKHEYFESIMNIRK